MPFKSVAQQRWAHTAAGEQALGGPGKVNEWDQASKGMKLPKRIGPPKASPYGAPSRPSLAGGFQKP